MAEWIECEALERIVKNVFEDIKTIRKQPDEESGTAIKHKKYSKGEYTFDIKDKSELYEIWYILSEESKDAKGRKLPRNKKGSDKKRIIENLRSIAHEVSKHFSIDDFDNIIDVVRSLEEQEVFTANQFAHSRGERIRSFLIENDTNPENIEEIVRFIVDGVLVMAVKPEQYESELLEIKTFLEPE